MQEQQLRDQERRIAKLEELQETQNGSLHRIELTLAEVKGAVSLMRLTLPLIVGIGGLTVSAIALLK